MNTNNTEEKIKEIALNVIIQVLWEAEKGIDRRDIIYLGKEMAELIDKWQPEVANVLSQVYEDSKKNPYWSKRTN